MSAVKKFGDIMLQQVIFFTGDGEGFKEKESLKHVSSVLKRGKKLNRSERDGNVCLSVRERGDGIKE